MLKSGKIFISFVFILWSNLLFGQNTTNVSRLAIMHFSSEGIDSVTIKSAETILRLELAKLSSAEVLGVNTQNDSAGYDCKSLECEVKYGEKLNADQVVTCNLLVLGKKIIIQYALIDVKQRKVLIDDSITSLSVEELDLIMKRIAMSVINHKSADETAEVGTIIEQETKKPLLRNGGKFYSFSFGYLYPTSGFKNEERSFTVDFRIGADIPDLEYGLQLFARDGFGVNIFSSYLATQTDVCPYIGGGLGFHWITTMTKTEYIYSDDGTYTRKEDNRQEDGFEFLVNTGLRLFNTYNFRITMNLAYSHTFNDFNSNSITLTIGFLK